MNLDFLDAHERHWEDAQLLERNGRLPNADQLYGVSAECGLKRLMIYFGMKLVPDSLTGIDKPADKNDKVHANKIWSQYQSHLSGALASRYTLPKLNPFSDWNVDQRYAHRNNFDSTRLANHRTGTELVRVLIAKAKRDGLL